LGESSSYLQFFTEPRETENLGEETLEADAHSAVPWTDLLRAVTYLLMDIRKPQTSKPPVWMVFFFKTRKEWNMKIPTSTGEFTMAPEMLAQNFDVQCS